MKIRLIIFGVLIAGFVVFNLFLQTGNERTDTAVNIIYASILFGYISFMAFSLIKKMKK
ncbi:MULTISPECIES: hypothetical protein [Chryseobacterium]|uniref:Signal peptidase n=1 Tax=Chryseobacterium nepalense TaxID=1854498 RepID=A0ABY4K3L3_9FLAO|nr:MULTISPECIES: hypothetical protein [Chryseobacterium]MEC5172153.1 hypothetical protein [Chryseobacterium nepalense]UPQ75252.1 hypothetical protein M0D58_14520 [Chryseobacterium nepalense]